PLRRRLRLRLRAEGGRRAGARRTAKAFRQVRSNAASRQDAARAISSAGPRRRGWRRGAGDLRPSGLHASLGAFSGRQLGREAADGEGPLQSHATPHPPLVSNAPARGCRSTAARSRAKAARALRVLRRDVELPGARAAAARGEGHLAQVALAPVADSLLELG